MKTTTKLKDLIDKSNTTINTTKYSSVLCSSIPSSEKVVDINKLTNLILKDVLETIATKGNYQVGAINAFYSVCEDYGLEEVYNEYHVANYEEYHGS